MKPLSLFLLVALVTLGCETTSPPSTTLPDGAEVPAEDAAFLDTLQQRTFGYFWETTNPANGLVPDRWPRETFASIAAVGFGLTSYAVGAERGYITHEAAADRTLATLRFFWEAPHGPDSTGMTGYKGFYYHFLDMNTGERFGTTELSTIDTALLMGGVLFAREYYDGDDATESDIRAYADSLFQRVEWDWYQVHSPLITMAWRPERNFGQAEYGGYNEAMLLYVMALGSPTFPIEPDAWDTYTSTYTWGDFYGQEHVNFSPLFGHQYSHVWIDFRDIQDAYMRERGIDYFENSRRATYSQQAYAVDNPGGWSDYSDEIWGLTACDGPAGVEMPFGGEQRRFYTYWARGASLEHINDDGTIAPTAAGGSIAFAPEITIPTLKAMRDRYGEALFNQYGFLDAFNPSFTFEEVELGHGRIVPGQGWFDTDYLGIDQGPILLMAENYRSALIWDVMRESPYLIRGLKRAGFTGGWLDEKDMPEIEVVISAE